jgi:GrpB-like predicted nucleotidyltransferase (UPF0157 family)
MPHDEPDRPDPPREWAGLGLDYGTVRLTEARPEWGWLAKDLADRIRAALGESAPGVEHVGSTAVPGLAAKPILDLAAGVNGVSIEAVRDPLEGLGYEYRGDAGDRGGLVFVLEDRPRHRVAHVHVVEHGGPQWQRYLDFRDLLRRDASARTAYERLKTELAREFADDRKAYSAAKQGIVRNLLEQHDRHQTE